MTKQGKRILGVLGIVAGIWALPALYDETLSDEQRFMRKQQEARIAYESQQAARTLRSNAETSPDRDRAQQQRIETFREVSFAYEWDWVLRAGVKPGGRLELTVNAQMSRGWPVSDCKAKQNLLADVFEGWRSHNPSARGVRLVNVSGRTLGVHPYHCFE